MVDLLALHASPWYWAAVVALTFVLVKLTGRAMGDFESFVCFILAQYAVHSVHIFGYSSIPTFCVLFAVLFASSCRISGRHQEAEVYASHEPRWFLICRAYLAVYFGARLILFPFSTGALDLAQRLEIQDQNPVMFLLSLAYLPAVAGFVDGLLGRHRISLVDGGVIALTIAGILGSASKGGFFALAVAVIGTLFFRRKRGRRLSVAMLSIVALAPLAFWQLSNLLNARNVGDVIQAITFRLVANTDSLSYLRVLGRAPDAFPEVGWPSMLPFVARLVGEAPDYSPGVWLHGSATGDWSGFGPNPGIVMDYLGNLGMLGLLVAVAMGIGMQQARRLPMGAPSFLALGHLAVTDVVILQVALGVWVAIYVVVRATPSRSIIGDDNDEEYADETLPSGRT